MFNMNKNILTVLLAVSLNACVGSDGNFQVKVTVPATPQAGESCSVSKVAEGSVITCPDGSTEYVYNGTNGTDGVDGQDGVDGTNGVDGQDGLNGENGVDGDKGDKGDKGDTGEQGPQGPKGDQGEAGIPLDSDSGYIVGYIDPCGNYTGLDEILFVLSDGRYAAWYVNLGIAILNDGTYRTTDAQQCRFTISNNGTTYSE